MTEYFESVKRARKVKASAITFLRALAGEYRNTAVHANDARNREVLRERAMEADDMANKLGR